MSMKKTDLEKHKAKKLDGRMKTGLTPDRFGRGAAIAKGKGEKQPVAAPPIKLVPITCRLPADLLVQLRERAVSVDGGISGLLAQAAEHWLAGEKVAKGV